MDLGLVSSCDSYRWALARVHIHSCYIPSRDIRDNPPAELKGDVDLLGEPRALGLYYHQTLAKSTIRLSPLLSGGWPDMVRLPEGAAAAARR